MLYLEFSRISVEAHSKDVSVMLVNSNFKPFPLSSNNKALWNWSPNMGSAKTGTPKCTASVWLNKPQCDMNNLTFGWAFYGKYYFYYIIYMLLLKKNQILT